MNCSVCRCSLGISLVQVYVPLSLFIGVYSAGFIFLFEFIFSQFTSSWVYIPLFKFIFHSRVYIPLRIYPPEFIFGEFCSHRWWTPPALSIRNATLSASSVCSSGSYVSFYPLLLLSPANLHWILTESLVDLQWISSEYSVDLNPRWNSSESSVDLLCISVDLLRISPPNPLNHCWITTAEIGRDLFSGDLQRMPTTSTESR